MKHKMVTDNHHGELVVFLLGMRMHRTWRLDQTFFVARAMIRMQGELRADRTRGEAFGYLGGFNALTAAGPLVVQYWRDFDSLENYANDADLEHRPAWLKLYRMSHSANASRVGLWHETYCVPQGAHESIYVDVPGSVGLAAAVGAEPLIKRGQSSRMRISAVGTS